MLLTALTAVPYLISATITPTKIVAFVILVAIVGGAFVYYRSRARSI